LLKAQNQPRRPAHLHALIFKPGFKVLISQVYDPKDPNIEVDPLFGVTKALLGDYVRHDEPQPSDAAIRTPWYALDYTYVMEAGDAALPQAYECTSPLIQNIGDPRAQIKASIRYLSDLLDPR
jgi:catechol 1,2-dioxygenase